MKSKKFRERVIRPKTWTIEKITLIFLLFLFGTAVKQYISEGFDSEWIKVIALAVFINGLLLSFINMTHKTLIITKDELIIKRPLILFSKSIPIKEIRGYDLYESYDNTNGTIRQLRLILADNSKILFHKNSYSDYSKIQRGFKSIGLRFLGTVEIKSKHKGKIAVLTRIFAILTALLFSLLGIIKLMN